MQDRIPQLEALTLQQHPDLAIAVAHAGRSDLAHAPACSAWIPPTSVVIRRARQLEQPTCARLADLVADFQVIHDPTPR